MSATRLLIGGGGTGGHVFPALALAEALKRVQPSCELLFVGSVGGLEERLVPAAGHRLELLRSAKLRGSGALGRLNALASLVPATARAAQIIGRFRPHVVVGLGGYASAPVVLAATALRRPVVLLEQNAIPGTVNRLLARLSSTVVTAFEGASRYLPAGRVQLLGNPVRQQFIQALERPLGPEGPQLLVLGGSQGAHAVNQLMLAAAPALCARVPGLSIRHQTGAADCDQVTKGYAAAAVPAQVEAFIEDMGAALARATLVLGRSGATTLAELCVAGCPALLVPYPYAADDHQAANAEELVQAGGALMVRQAELSAEQLGETLARLLLDSERLARMGQAMRGRGRPEAGEAIARMLLSRHGPPPEPG